MAAAPTRPPEIAFKLALHVCVLCARPDAGLEVLRLMPSVGLKPPLDAFKVRGFGGKFEIGFLVVFPPLFCSGMACRFPVELGVAWSVVSCRGERKVAYNCEEMCPCPLDLTSPPG